MTKREAGPDETAGRGKGGQAGDRVPESTDGSTERASDAKTVGTRRPRASGTRAAVQAGSRSGSKTETRSGAKGKAKGSAADPPESAVGAYLRAHPDFFERHPDILAAMQIEHDTGGAVSLIQRQVTVLRRQLDTERGRLTHLISRARDYEALSARLHDLVLHLIPADDLERLCAVLRDVLLREFSAEAVVLKLFPVQPQPSFGESRRPDPLVAAFQDFLERPHALCGPLDPAQGEILFGAAGAGLYSAVLVPIRAGGHCGVLAIGAQDRERFGPEMRTDVLDRLGEIVGAKLRTLPAAGLESPAPAPKPAPKPAKSPRKRPTRAKPQPAAESSEPKTPKATKPPKAPKPKAKRTPEVSPESASTADPADA